MDEPARARGVPTQARISRPRPARRAHARVLLIVAHFAMCAATAAACLVAVALYQARVSGDEDATSLAGWNEIAAQSNDLEQGI